MAVRRSQRKIDGQVGAMKYQGIPEWLGPYKNEWLTAGGIAKVMRIENCGGQVNKLPETQTWVTKNRDRIKRKSAGAAPNGKGEMWRYLVKSVWSVAKVDGLNVCETYETSSDLQKIRCLEREIELQKNARAPEIRVIHAKREFDKSDTLLLKLLVMASDPRPKPGVYFLVSDEGGVTYVGQSKNVISRMSGHQSKDYDFARMIEIPDDQQRLQIEMRLIKLLEPRDNLMGLTKSARGVELEPEHA